MVFGKWNIKIKKNKNPRLILIYLKYILIFKPFLMSCILKLKYKNKEGKNMKRKILKLIARADRLLFKIGDKILWFK